MNTKILFSILFSFSFMLLLTGCSAKEAIVSRQENEEGIFQQEVLSMELEEGEYVRQLAASNQKLVMHTMIANNNTLYGQKLYIKDWNTNEIKMVPYDFKDNKCIFMTADKNEVITMLLKNNNSDNSDLYELVQVDFYGNQIFEENISQQMERIMEKNNLLKMLSDDKGNIYFFVSSLKVFCWNKDSKALTESDEELQIMDMSQDRDGKIIFAVCNQDLNLEIKTGNLETGQFDFVVKLPQMREAGLSQLFPSSIYLFCYADGQAVYGYMEKEKRFEKVLDFQKSGLNMGTLSEFCEVSDYVFACVNTDTHKAGEMSEILVLSEAEKDAKKKVLTLGGINIPPIIIKAVSRYNQSSQEYRIEITDYGAYENPDTRINSEILGGEGFDLLCLNGLDGEKYMKKGLLEDIYPYFEQDEAIDREDLLPEVLNILEHNGKLYYITPGFCITTAVARSSVVGEKAGISPMEFQKLLEKQPDDVRAFYKETRDGMLSHLCKEIDRNGKDLKYDNFKYYLETAKQLSNDSEKISLLEAVKKKDFLLIKDNFVEFNDILIYQRMFGEDVTFIGYPVQTGNGNSLNCMGMNVGICSNSTNKEAAWEFIKILLSEEFQYYNYPNCFPTRKDCMDRVIKMVSATEEYEDKDGNTVSPYHCDMTYDDVEIVIEPMSQEEEKKFWTLLGTLEYQEMWDEEIWNIVSQEAEDYFEGQRSVEETISGIQNRLEVYWNES